MDWGKSLASSRWACHGDLLKTDFQIIGVMFRGLAVYPTEYVDSCTFVLQQTCF
jgi:hypothetical protein